MADQQHVELLKQKVNWNSWRREHPEIHPNLSRSDLSGTNLSNANLAETNLSNANLAESDLAGSDLTRADLSRADLSRADLSGADLSGADLEDARSLVTTKMYRVQGLTQKQLDYCRAKGAIFDEDVFTAKNATTPPASKKEKQGVLEADSTAVSDTPKEDVSQDRLNFASYVEALYKFITAEETTAPLAISINGAWGTGKSSLMRMLMQRLEPADRKHWRMHRQGLAWRIGRSTWLTRLLLRGEDPQKQKELLEIITAPSQSVSPNQASKKRKQLPAPYYPTVWFNAWKFSQEEQIWSALALEVLNQLNQKKYTLLSRLLFWFHLTLKRAKFGRLVSSLLLPVVFALGTVIYTVFILPHLQLTLPDTAISAKTIATWVGPVLGGATLASLLTTFYNALKKHPFKIEVKDFFNPPDYQDKIGYIGRFDEDFKHIVDAVTHLRSKAWQTQKLVIFIDDLDRCRPLQAIGIIEAISLFLDSEQCVFVLGMDLGAITASIETKYKELMEKIRQENPGIASPGSLFLDKIIQISLNTPQPKDANITALIRDILKVSQDKQSVDVPGEKKPEDLQAKQPVDVPGGNPLFQKSAGLASPPAPIAITAEYFQKKDVQEAIEYASNYSRKTHDR